LHVVADAATSVLALVALAGGWWLGWSWLDPVMGIAGALLVAHWARGLLRQTSSALLDRDMDHPVVQEIREALIFDAPAHRTTLTDLHVWRVGAQRYACALTLTSSDPGLDAALVRQRLAEHEEIVHSTIEIHRTGV
jgi:Co/Zn/Cd efflux system component